MMPGGQTLSGTQRPAFAVVPLRTHSEHSVLHALLGNELLQAPELSRDFADRDARFFQSLVDRFITTEPALRLAILKKQKFTPEGREDRIRTSLAALDGPQPTNLTPQEWREIVEEVEEED